MSTTVPKNETEMLREIGVTAENPTAFDILGVPDSCEDDKRIKDEARQRNKALTKWEQYKADATVSKAATAVKIRIADAQKKLKNANSREAYRKEALAGRIEAFRKRVTAAVRASGELNEDRIRQLAALGKEYGVDEATAREEITRLAAADNPFVVLGISRIQADEAWPTAFDVLMVEESDKPPADVEKHAASQMRKVDAALQMQKIEPEEAVRLRSYVQEAAVTFSSPDLTKAYRHELRKQRFVRYQNLVKVAIANADISQASALLQLVHQGRQMRLSQQDIGTVLKKMANIDIEEALGSSPTLSLNRAEIVAYVSGDGRGSQEVISVRNDGTGELDVHVESDQPWIEIEETHFRTKTRRDVRIKLPPQRLRPGETLSGTVRLKSNGGDLEVEINALLGRPGSEATLEDYGKAAGAYFMGLGFIFFLPFVILSWRFMMSRRESSFLAFHAAQSMCFGLGLFLALMCIALMVTFAVPSPGDTDGPPPSPNNSIMCTACCFLLLLGVSWIAAPVAMGIMTKDGKNIQIPGISPLIRRLL